MKKLVTALLLPALLFLISAAPPAGAYGFIVPAPYSVNMFSDVSDTDWFSQYVGTVYCFGFMHGKGGDIFDPDGFLTLGEAVTLASRLRSYYYGDNAVFYSEGAPFYTPYAEYAFDNAIINEHGDYSKNAARAQFALLIYNALPSAAFDEINTIPDYSICDVSPESEFGNAVYTLYRAGIMTGSDRYGTFYPDSYITRAQVSAVLARIVKPELRCYASLPVSMPAEVIFERNADAVFMLETFGEGGDTIRTGSGFFISAEGLAVTSAHVFTGASYAIATLNDGRMYPVLGINAMNPELNLAVFTIERDTDNWPYLTLYDSRLLRTGTPVYVLSSPLTLVNSISAGVVSNTDRDTDGQSFFQFTAAISFGSGGGPVLNSLGQASGVACSSFSAGQRLNLAVPISLLGEMTIGDCLPLNSFLAPQPD